MPRPFTVGISDARHSRTVVSIAAAERGWTLETVQSKPADVFVLVCEDDITRRLECLKAGQRMSRIPGMLELCDKSAFATLMHSMQEEDAEGFDFFPRTYILPGDQVPKRAWKRPMIFKPDAGACGEGIYILTSESDLQRRMSLLKAESAVLQEYIPKPMLLDGFKWDIRVYAVILSMDPLRVVLCQEGLARVCSEPYVEATSRNVHKIGSHLTNYSISKYTTEFEHHDDPTDGSRGSKRTLTSTMQHLHGLGHDVESLNAQIHHIVAATSKAMVNELMEVADRKTSRQCYHILGFDVIFDQRGKAWLLEVNWSPSLAIDSVFPTTGPHATEPAPLPDGVPEGVHNLMDVARETMGAKAVKVCKCMSHHRPHLHAPCAVDLVAKSTCVGDTIEVVRRLARAAKRKEVVAVSDAIEGTSFMLVHDES